MFIDLSNFAESKVNEKGVSFNKRFLILIEIVYVSIKS